MCEGWGGAGSRPSGPDSETGATCHSGPPAATTGGCGGKGDDTRLQWRRRRLQGGGRGGDAALPKPPPIKEEGEWLWRPGMALAGRIRRLLSGCTSHFCSPASSGPSWVGGARGGDNQPVQPTAPPLEVKPEGRASHGEGGDRASHREGGEGTSHQGAVPLPPPEVTRGGAWVSMATPLPGDRLKG